MKVILQRNVPNLGDAGEVKEVKRGYARNYLLPRKLAIVAHAGSRRANEHQQRLIQQKETKRKEEMSALAGKLKNVDSIEIPVRVGSKNKMYGSVTAMNIAEKLAELGHSVDRRKIELGEKIRNLGTYNLKIKLAENITVPLTVHVTKDESLSDEEEEEYLSPEERAAAAAEAAASAEAAGEGDASDESSPEEASEEA